MTSDIQLKELNRLMELTITVRKLQENEFVLVAEDAEYVLYLIEQKGRELVKQMLTCSGIESDII